MGGQQPGLPTGEEEDGLGGVAVDGDVGREGGDRGQHRRVVPGGGGESPAADAGVGEAVGHPRARLDAVEGEEGEAGRGRRGTGPSGEVPVEPGQEAHHRHHVEDGEEAQVETAGGVEQDPVDDQHGQVDDGEGGQEEAEHVGRPESARPAADRRRRPRPAPPTTTAVATPRTGHDTNGGSTHRERLRAPLTQ